MLKLFTFLCYDLFRLSLINYMPYINLVNGRSDFIVFAFKLNFNP